MDHKDSIIMRLTCILIGVLAIIFFSSLCDGKTVALWVECQTPVL